LGQQQARIEASTSTTLLNTMKEVTLSRSLKLAHKHNLITKNETNSSEIVVGNILKSVEFEIKTRKICIGICIERSSLLKFS